jgi:hypothetical protein
MNNGNEKAKMATKKNTLALISFFVKKCIVFMQNMCMSLLPSVARQLPILDVT